MSQMTNFMENKLADFFRGQGLTLPASWFFGLGSAADDASFTELSGTGYARQPVVRSLANFAGTQAVGSTVASSGTTHRTSNNGALDWGTPGSSWGTCAFVGIFDALTSGNCWIWLSVPSFVVSSGVPITPIAAGALTMELGLASGCTDYLCNKLVDLLLRAQAYTWPSSTYLAAFTAAPTNAGGGTEVSGSGYARIAIASSLAAWCGTQSAGSTVASSGSAGVISNNDALSYPDPTGDWGDLASEGLYDAPSSGHLLFYGPLGDTITVNNGGTPPSHAAGTIQLTIA